ncbi:MAG: TonB family protein [Chitinispirillaceae bacterium]|nr:TonB family protein [Chitinispirillaceae bacterium]
MTYQTMPLFERETFKRVPTPAVLTVSILFHVLFLVVIPLLSRIFYNSRRFERPKTFQLVASPLRPSPARRVPVTAEARKQRMPQQETKAQPRQLPDPNAPRNRREARKEKDAARPIHENLDELASILDEIPAPAQVAAVGNFKYHWYLNNVQQKLERYWNPGSENRTVKVIVSFTIHQDGSISDPSIHSSSGNGMLDNLALRAVKLAAPFGKLPPGFADNRLDLNCTLIPTRK